MSSIICTFSGNRIDLLDPQPEDIRLIDIAVGLCRAPRFTGQTYRPWTVAQHSLAVAGLVPQHLRLQAAMHDAAEAFLGDISTPLKFALGEQCRVIFSKMEHAIATAFGYEAALAPQVKEADRMLLISESAYLFAQGNRSFGFTEPPMAYCDWHAIEKNLRGLDMQSFLDEIQKILAEAGTQPLVTTGA